MCVTGANCKLSTCGLQASPKAGAKTSNKLGPQDLEPHAPDRTGVKVDSLGKASAVLGLSSRLKLDLVVQD